VLVSPSEHRLKGLGKVSSQPEKFGCDFLFVGAGGLVGVQRKEVKDLVASLHDGRLAKELGQMKGLAQGIVLIEGEVRWTNSGTILGLRTSFTRTQLYGVVFSIQSGGVWVITTGGLEETRQVLPLVESWLRKQRHGSLSGRPNPQGDWGHVGSRDWGVHLLQSFNGIGFEVAGRIYDHFGGVPLAWTVGEDKLMEVRGVGKGRAEVLVNALRARGDEV
jgi:ERCC4-type nuclease